MRNVVQQSFVVFTIGEKSYTVVYQKYMKENVVSSEISIQNKAEMSFQMKRHRTYFRTRHLATTVPHYSTWVLDNHARENGRQGLLTNKCKILFEFIPNNILNFDYCCVSYFGVGDIELIPNLLSY